MSSVFQSDLAVLGAGPGGYVAAIRAAQLGQKVAIIDRERPGGVCLNWGCIPTKALLTGAEWVENLKFHGETFGISSSGVLELDYSKAIAHSRKVSDTLCKGVHSLLKKNQIEYFQGEGRLSGKRGLNVLSPKEVQVEAAHILLATGSEDFVPRGVTIDGKRILTSREALESSEVPERIVIVGAGAVGIEFAYIYSMYGAKVTVVEMADQVLPGADEELSVVLRRSLQKKGIKFIMNTRFDDVAVTSKSACLSLKQNEKDLEIEADQVLLAIGRRPLVKNLGFEELGVGLTERGFLEIDGTLQTNIHSISAIGDLAGPPLLAHKASEEGVAAVEFISGVKRPEIDYKRIPGCIYSQPQVAWIGLTEKEAQLVFGEGCRVGKFPFVASGKAVASVHKAGFSKIIAEPRYGQIVGAHIVGHGATELIAEIGLAMTLEATTEEISGTVHAHPTMSESIMEASLAAEGRSINF